MQTPRHGASPEIISDYVKTHCATCAAGWKRETAAGEMLIICLLDREPAWAAMTHCDRYEAKELTPEARAADPQPSAKPQATPGQPGYLPPGQPRGK
jgi:hypothetical protein